ncbi:MAG: type II toxin-antitoxin system prevent-host-death family antitoxin [Gemmatimonadales bacterium]|nr:type II toxin-antitoxin system prevent-host-death family antitoxin [Gemmatimonadales bacterium]
MSRRKRTTAGRTAATDHSMEVTASDFRNACAERMEAVARTQRTLTVTKHGKPYVQVMPAAARPTDPIGFMAGTVVRAAGLVAPDEAAWEENAGDPLQGP